MTDPSPRMALSVAVQAFSASVDEIRSRAARIHEELRAASAYVREANFNRIHPRDLEFLFDAYDRQFLDGRCRAALDGRTLTFRLSRRMTRSGGSTTQLRHTSGVASYEIAIAVSMLFDAFTEPQRRVEVCGLECLDRLQAMQRIFEHEMVHLMENLIWGTSECAAPRFQDIAKRLFLHSSHKHDLITRREKAADMGIRVGSRVVFAFEGQRIEGRVNRITQRATVLVDHPEGVRYSDGRRYRKYYIPLAHLQPLK
jgi:hypothetical protein